MGGLLIVLLLLPMKSLVLLDPQTPPLGLNDLMTHVIAQDVDEAIAKMILMMIIVVIIAVQLPQNHRKKS
jgi:hypothetical protein